MSDFIFAAILALTVAMTVFFILTAIGPPKGLWCNSKEKHEFGLWQDFVGPSKNHHYQSKTCKNVVIKK
jgi:hypothetical protein